MTGLIGAFNNLSASDINIYNIHFKTIDVLLSNNCGSKFLICGDYYLPNINLQYVNGSNVTTIRFYVPSSPNN